MNLAMYFLMTICVLMGVFLVNLDNFISYGNRTWTLFPKVAVSFIVPVVSIMIEAVIFFTGSAGHVDHEKQIMADDAAIVQLYKFMHSGSPDLSGVHIITDKGELTHLAPEATIIGIDMIKEENGNALAKIVEVYPHPELGVYTRDTKNVFLPTETLTEIKKHIFRVNAVKRISFQDKDVSMYDPINVNKEMSQIKHMLN